MARTIFES